MQQGLDSSYVLDLVINCYQALIVAVFARLLICHVYFNCFVTFDKGDIRIKFPKFFFLCSCAQMRRSLVAKSMNYCTSD